MTRRFAALLAALAMASACRSPTAPDRYEGPCAVSFPREAPFVTLCYNECPWTAEEFAAEGDGQYTVLSAPCGTATP